MTEIIIKQPRQDYKTLFPREYNLNGKKCIIKNIEELERFKKYVVGKRVRVKRNVDMSVARDSTKSYKYEQF